MIEFGRVAYLGTAKWNPTIHSPSDREAVHHELDRLMQQGELPWSAERNRCVRFTCGTVEVVTREEPEGSPSPRGSDPSISPVGRRQMGPTVLEVYGLDEVFNVVYLDDAPHHLVCFFCGPTPRRATCTVIQVPSPEVALAMCEVFEHVVSFVHQQSILQSVDDHIMAGIEGRDTAIEVRQAEDRRLRRMSWAIRESDPSESGGTPGRFGRRASVRKMFDAERGAPDNEEGEEDDVFATFSEGRAELPPPKSRLVARPSLMKGYRPPQSQNGAGPAQPNAATNRNNAELHAYVDLVKGSLNEDEMRRFKGLVSNYRRGGTFHEFSTSLMNLFGPSRRNLLPGIRNFVPGNDRPECDRFIAREVPNAVLPVPEDNPPPKRGPSVRQHATSLEFYMQQLKRELTGEGEMQRFALLLRDYRTGGEFSDFAQGLKDVFGPERKALLPGMKHFVPAADRPLYEAFVKQQ